MGAGKEGLVIASAPEVSPSAGVAATSEIDSGSSSENFGADDNETVVASSSTWLSIS
jgi:hypothetical protein